ncbi:MAG: acyl-CoA thioesterase [Candidatus Cloacimonetes bacterium]|nr:acyl-CoA thioesterase [Candidatus Cloacimonadota bacterium]MCF7814327.1 acyl-CoA thioesterase [Candidatus Cloacimonadota bacterium]MCF7868981.1 acyl-CoA thioesterase [Candidatus Cloacimonadota bacterium]MCF7884375.1 acyl-CoA thioesterase [Candidatus Cloacimonadota bacterium]
MPRKLEYKRKIFGYECDVYGHLNNANYLHIYEEARADALEQMQIPIRELAEIGYHIYLTNIELEFIKGLPLESKVTIRSHIEKSNRLQSTWIQEIYNEAEEICSSAVVKGAFVKNGKPTRISKELYKVFQLNSQE